jgi:hypothetical protein
MLTTNFHKDTPLTQRPLTPSEQADARAAYNAIGRLYNATKASTLLVEASVFIDSLILHNTTDGKPLRTERVPTKDDIGKRVKVKRFGMRDWEVCRTFVFVGFDRKGRYVVQSAACDLLSSWDCCIIDEGAAK